MEEEAKKLLSNLAVNPPWPFRLLGYSNISPPAELSLHYWTHQYSCVQAARRGHHLTSMLNSTVAFQDSKIRGCWNNGMVTQELCKRLHALLQS
jgi:hypothetical protein